MTGKRDSGSDSYSGGRTTTQKGLKSLFRPGLYILLKYTYWALNPPLVCTLETSMEPAIETMKNKREILRTRIPCPFRMVEYIFFIRSVRAPHVVCLLRK